MSAEFRDGKSSDDSLLNLAEMLRAKAIQQLSPETRAQRGQFFTPGRAAALITNLVTLPRTGKLKVLDPGAGTGILTAALVERVTADAPGVAVEITEVEVDRDLTPYLEETAHLCENWARERGVDVSIEVRCEDLIESSTGLWATPHRDYDLVIMNPPYAKISTSSSMRRALNSQGWDCPNLYAAFLAIGVEALRVKGQLVAITPRSFANGLYYSAFRRRLLQLVAINRMHTFESRSTVFADTGVLQENVVFSATRAGLHERIRITQSRDHTDRASEYLVEYTDLVQTTDPESFIRIMTNESDTMVTERMVRLPASLSNLGMQVSTGRVVDFRSRENLRDEPTSLDKPLIYPGNLRDGRVEWPLPIRKAQGFRPLIDDDQRALMPSGCYVIVKRFSAKEERRRIVAALWEPAHNGRQEVAFENHLNVFHRSGAGLDRELAWGLCLWLNGSLVDQFFRTFSGHTQVNAHDLRSLRFPEESTLKALGRRTNVLPSQEHLDALIDSLIIESVPR